MPSQSQASGSSGDAFTVNTDTDLGGADLTTAGIYVLLVDAAPIADGDTLIAYFKQKVLTGDSLVEQDRLTLAKHAQSQDLVSFGPYEIIHAGRFGLRCEGTGRTLKWSVRRLDG